MVQTAVAQTWEQYSKAKFVGWDTCSPSSNGIHILISDEQPHVQALGHYLNRYPSGMILNFHFQNWSRECATKRDFCIYAVAAHEL